MRYNKYGHGDPYSEWHRIYAGIAMIDIDQVEACKNCKEPLLLVEAAYDDGKYNKAYRTTQRLAQRADLPAYLLYWTRKNGHMTWFKIRKIAPKETSTLTQITPSQWLRVLFMIHRKHKCNAPVI